MIDVAYESAGILEANRGPLLRLHLTHLIAGRYPDLFLHASARDRRSFITEAFAMLDEWFPGWRPGRDLPRAVAKPGAALHQHARVGVEPVLRPAGPRLHGGARTTRGVRSESMTRLRARPPSVSNRSRHIGINLAEGVGVRALDSAPVSWRLGAGCDSCSTVARGWVHRP